MRRSRSTFAAELAACLLVTLLEPDLLVAIYATPFVCEAKAAGCLDCAGDSWFT